MCRYLINEVGQSIAKGRGLAKDPNLIKPQSDVINQATKLFLQLFLNVYIMFTGRYVHNHLG